MELSALSSNISFPEFTEKDFTLPSALAQVMRGSLLELCHLKLESCFLYGGQTNIYNIHIVRVLF